MEDARGGVHGASKQRKSMARLLADREANRCPKTGQRLRTLTQDALRHLEPSSSLWLSSPPGASSITALQVDTTECRYLLAGAGNGVVFAYDLEGVRRAGDGESEAGASAHELESKGLLEPLFSTGTARESSPTPLIPAHPQGAPSPAASAAEAAMGQSAAGHQSRVSALEWYPLDTGLFISGSVDSTVRVWDTNLLQTELVFDMAARVHSLSMTQSTHSPVHSLVAVASHSPDVRLCDLNSATCSHTLTGHQGAVTSVRWLPCSDWELMSSSRDGAVKQWDVRKTFPCLRSLDHDSTQVGLRSTLLSPPPASAYWPPEPRRASRGRRPSAQAPAPLPWQRAQGAAAVNFVGSVIRRDSKAMQKWSKAGNAGHPSAAPSHFKNGAYIRAHEGAATCVRSVLNGLFVLSAGSEPRLKLWDMDSGCDTMLHYNMPRAAAPVSASGGLAESAIAVSADGSLLFVPWGLNLRVYDTFSASCVGVLKGHFDRILSCAARQGVPQVFTGGADGQVVCWDDPSLLGSLGGGVTEVPRRTLRRRIALAGGIGHVIEPLPDEDFWSD